MKKLTKLVQEVMGVISKDIEGASDTLCEIIDSLTDENGNSLPHINKDLVNKLKQVSYNLYEMHCDIIPTESDGLVDEINYYKKGL